ncbi:unnamed protein product [Microthlaspi erraticum]|uniref:Phytocyanin domain-containing protein n=1 Tax=Microthlaspi erraticum TaxID=1685480 RepID=A0A6D2KUZ3_9BRAS|nr:unnamed protein product [Microthlaspi erraticum]
MDGLPRTMSITIGPNVRNSTWEILWSFEYDRNVNDVTQVSGSLEYEFCDTSSPKAVYNTGHDVVTLTEPGFYYFITSNQAQCASGQKLDVLVVVHDPSMTSIPSGEEKQFHVGDVLLFEYGNEVNDVIEINGDLEFISCDPTSPVAVHKTGHDLVRLTEPGVRYFISSEPGRCGLDLSFEWWCNHSPKLLLTQTFPRRRTCQ